MIVVKIVVDSYAWIEIFLGSEKGQSAFSAIQEAELVLTPEIVLAEIARKYIREGIAEKVIRARLNTVSQSSELTRIDEPIAVESGKTYLELSKKAKESGRRKPSLFDAIILATARVNEAKVLTGDLHFRDLPDTIRL
ncbi:MAG: PIN domain-containing protein [Thaumarchaeota archaeon]|nr:PIN domain-containing protein [Nitrososphaerota archaeon]